MEEAPRARCSRRPLIRRGLLLLLALVTALHMPLAGVCDARELSCLVHNTCGGSAALRGGQRARGAGTVHGHAHKHDIKRFRLLRRPVTPGAGPLQPDESSLPSSADADVSETATEVLAQERIETKTAARRSRADASAAVHFGAGVAACHNWHADGERRPAFAREVVVEALEEAFGIRSFRDGQEETISRVLAGNNTLFLSATGSGKSLTYLLPTLLWKRRRVAAGSARAKRGAPGAPAAAKEEPGESGVAGGGGGGGGGETGLTLVVSPLLALIRDQLQHLPPGLKGASLSSDMSSSEQAQVTQLLLSRDLLYFRP